MVHRPPGESPLPRRRRPPPDPEEQLVQGNLRILIAANAMVALVLAAAPGGRSPALGTLAILAPLPVWGLLGYGGVVVLLAARVYVWGHRLAVVLWFILGGALVLGVTTGASQSPAASLIFAGLACVLLALHSNGLRYRRARRLVQKSPPSTGQ